MRPLELSGKTFGRLTVVRRGPNAGSKTRWVCKCVCGRDSLCVGHNLISGHTTSCGCARDRSHLKHGKCRTRLYGIWHGMRTRCSNVNSEDYPDYGGRGIRVCERWQDDFEAFAADMGEPPPGTTIDRINNDGNYDPGNCRWATRAEQSRNTRRNRIIEFKGKRLCVAEWAREIGMLPDRLATRLHRGWPIARALTTPVRQESR
jgi:hypothetical protein